MGIEGASMVVDAVDTVVARLIVAQASEYVDVVAATAERRRELADVHGKASDWD